MMTQTNIYKNAVLDRFAFAGEFLESYVKRCLQCEREVEMISPFDAAGLTNATVYSIYRRAEIGKVHFGVTKHGELMICRDSLT